MFSKIIAGWGVMLKTPVDRGDISVCQSTLMKLLNEDSCGNIILQIIKVNVCQ